MRTFDKITVSRNQLIFDLWLNACKSTGVFLKLRTILPKLDIFFVNLYKMWNYFYIDFVFVERPDQVFKTSVSPNIDLSQQLLHFYCESHSPKFLLTYS